MIVTGDNKLAQAEPDKVQPTNRDSLPPPYSNSGNAPPAVPEKTQNEKHGRAGTADVPPRLSADGPSSFRVVAPPNIRRSNLVHIRRKYEGIAEKFVIDPSVAPPPSRVFSTGGLEDANAEASDDAEWDWWAEDVESIVGAKPDSSAGKDKERAVTVNPRKEVKENLLLESLHANVNAEVWVVRSSNEIGAQPVLITVRCKHGSASLKLHDAQASSGSSAAPFKVSISARHGIVKLFLPRSFVGPITTRTRHGWVQHSADVAPHISVFSEVKGVRKAFMGEYDASQLGEKDEWKGSSVDITAVHGRIRIMFADEVDNAKGVFGKMFSIFSGGATA